MQTAKFIYWRDRYSVGHADIDKDHQEIISIINDLYTAINRKTDHEVIKDILSRLLDYTRYHFNREETILKNCAFPELEKHMTQHRQMVEKTRELQDRNMQNENDIPLETMSFLKD